LVVLSVIFIVYKSFKLPLFFIVAVIIDCKYRPTFCITYTAEYYFNVAVSVGLFRD